MKFMYNGEMCTVEFSKYREIDNTAICLYTEDGELMTIATVNIRPLDSNLVAIKNYSENEGIEEVLIKNGFINSEPIHYIESGYVNVPIYELTEKSINIINNEVN